MKNGVRASVGKMICAAACIAAVFAVIGLLIGLFYFSQEARPVSRTVRDAAAWTAKFYTIYFAGCGFSCVYTILAARFPSFFGYARINWIINMIVTTVVGLVLAALMFILFQTKDMSINLLSALLIFIQGLLIFFISSFFAPASWVYNPLKS